MADAKVQEEAAGSSMFEVVVHSCSRCPYPYGPTRSCDWDAGGVGDGNEFTTEAEARAAIPQMMAMFGDEDESQYRVRRIGNRYPEAE